MDQSPAELIVPMARARLLVVLLGALAFVGAGVWLVVRRDEVGAQFAGWAAITFFGACGLWSLRRLRHPRAMVEIRAEGLVDRASAIGVGLIRWPEIADAFVYHFGRRPMLGIEVHDLDALLQRLPRWKRWALAANMWLGAAPINIPGTLLPVPLEALIERMAAHMRSSE
ncbi:MAG: STM3941 family protein [Planctomycetota bacterium]